LVRCKPAVWCVPGCVAGVQPPCCIPNSVRDPLYSPCVPCWTAAVGEGKLWPCTPAAVLEVRRKAPGVQQTLLLVLVGLLWS